MADQLGLFDEPDLPRHPPGERKPLEPKVVRPQPRRHVAHEASLGLTWKCSDCGTADVLAPGSACVDCARIAREKADREAALADAWRLATLVEQQERVLDHAWWEWVEPEDALAVKLAWATLPEAQWDRDEDGRAFAFNRRRWEAGYAIARHNREFVDWWPMPRDVAVERVVEEWWFEVEEDFWEPEPWLVPVPLVLDIEPNPAYL